MKSHRLALLMVAGFVSPAFATQINFDNLTGGAIFTGDLVTTQYAGQGATFSDATGSGARANNTLTPLVTGDSAPNVLFVDQGSGGPLGAFLNVAFSSPVHNVSTIFGTSLTADITLEAYNGNTLLGSSNTIGPNINTGVRSGTVSIGSAQNITSVHLYSTSSSSAFNFEIDNFTFDAVPEPASLSMLAGGSVLLLIRRRR